MSDDIPALIAEIREMSEPLPDEDRLAMLTKLADAFEAEHELCATYRENIKLHIAAANKAQARIAELTSAFSKTNGEVNQTLGKANHWQAEHAAAAGRVTDLELRLQQYMDMLEDYSSKSRQAQARIAALEAALEPFRKAAEVLSSIGNVDPKDISIWSLPVGRDGTNVRITFADMYAVLAVLEKADE